jgi:glycosyltransferase, group 2 family
LEGLNAEILVVDNHSSDDSIIYLKAHFPSVRYIENHENMGFARANNIAIEQSRGEYVLLLNPDTIVGEGVLKAVLSFMERHSKAGAAGVCMLKADGSCAKESRRGLPTPMTALYKMTGLSRLFPNNKRLAHYYMGGISWDMPHQIEVVSGAFCFLRREALLQVGMLDDDYFMYGEDIELSCQLLLKGWENWYLPLKILHYKGESTAMTSYRYVHRFYKAMLIYIRKHYGVVSFAAYFLKIAIVFKALMVVVRQTVHKLLCSFGISFQQKKRRSYYVFIGQSAMLDDCQKIAKDYGLSALFIEGCPTNMPVIPEKKDFSLTYLVYDMDVFDYAFVLNDMASRANEGYSMGTYSSKILITEDKVIYGK